VTSVPVDFTVRFLDVDDASLFNPTSTRRPGGDHAGMRSGAFLFCPGALVTRADMAGFILRAVHGADFVPTPYAGAFHDVQAGDYNADYIQSFFDGGFTVGCGNGDFCPDAVHTRGQTAVFILKGTHGTSYLPPPCGTTHQFDDVPCPPTPEAVPETGSGSCRWRDHGGLRADDVLPGRRHPQRADGDVPGEGVSYRRSRP
jgi:hypothetical protein